MQINKCVSGDGSFKYFILRLDEGGFITKESSELETILKQEILTKKYTDVVILSHGLATSRENDESIDIANGAVQQMQVRKQKHSIVLYVTVK